MKKQLLSVAVLIIALFTLNSFNNSSFSAESSVGDAAAVYVCPGSGKGCVLWGAVEKGGDRGFIEIVKEKPIEIEIKN